MTALTLTLRRRSIVCFALVALALASLSVQAYSQVPPGHRQRPKLVLLIAIDQFRYDYLSRFRSEYTGGLATLLQRGASFANANLCHYPTVTAVGHSTMLSGATPALSGIIGNDWYDRTTGKQVTSVDDPSTKLLGGIGDHIGSSPHRLLVSAVGDELKRAVAGSKVIGLSLKDRSAILPSGHMSNGAYWFDEESGAFVSSTFYFPALPSWAADFNAKHEPDKFAGKIWLEAKDGQTERRTPSEPGRKLNDAVYGSPYGNDLLESFAEAAIDAEKLGTRGVTDLLTVSFSSNDAVGHTYGPDSPEVRSVSLNVDRAIARLFAHLDKTVGMSNVLVMLTADHGVSPTPELLQSQKMPGGRIRSDFFAPIKTALDRRFGAGLWLLSTAGSSPYLNYKLIEEKSLDAAEVRRVAAQAIATAPHVTRVYTRDQLTTMRGAADIIDSRVMRSYNAQRSGDLEVLLEPYWIRGGGTGATHGTPYNYDSHIPLVFMGPGVRPGTYYTTAVLNDLAPTVASMIEVEIPSGSVGRVLDEIIQMPAARPVPPPARKR